MQMIKTSALLLWLQLLNSVKCQHCTLGQFLNSDIFYPNFDPSGLDATYSEGAQVIVPCNTGYTGLFSLICTEGRWMQRGTKCQPKSCGRPGNSQFADVRLVNGDDFVFGSEVVYVCYKGYHLVSRTNRRRCLADGWDGNIPICEVTKCPVIHVDSNVQVSGDLEHATSGSTVWFSCKSKMETLFGPEKIICGDGAWSGLVPECRVNQATKCELSLLPIIGTTYDPPYKTMFSPGETLRVTCGEKHWILNTQTKVADVTCQNNGAWNIIPICQATKCPVIHVDSNVQVSGDLEHATSGSTVWFSCKSKMETLFGPEKIICEDGAWSGLVPECRVNQATKCELSLLPIIGTTYDPPYKIMFSPGETLRVTCGEKHWILNTQTKVADVTCQNNGAWNIIPICQVPTGCSAPPTLENGDTKLIIRADSEYQHGERIEYLCQTMYILDGGPFKICDNGMWKGDIRCLKPCTINEELMNEHNIGFAFTQKNKVYLSHRDHIIFRCKAGKRLVGNMSMRAQCNDGEITLPTCQ